LDSYEFFRLLREALVAAEGRPVPIGASNFSKLDYFVDRYADRHDQLTMRCLRGEDLTGDEQAMMLALDAVLDGVAPEQPGLPDDVNALVDRVLRARS
jgi:hypothetical protein